MSSIQNEDLLQLGKHVDGLYASLGESWHLRITPALSEEARRALATEKWNEAGRDLITLLQELKRELGEFDPTTTMQASLRLEQEIGSLLRPSGEPAIPAAANWASAPAALRLRGSTISMLRSYRGFAPYHLGRLTRSPEWHDAFRGNVLGEQWPGGGYTEILRAFPDICYTTNLYFLCEHAVFSEWWASECAQAGVSCDMTSHAGATRREMVLRTAAEWAERPTPADFPVYSTESDWFQDALDEVFSSVVMARLAEAWADEAGEQDVTGSP